ncbi:glycosyltransferase [Candidatus Peregrinibacteria bacterium]|nr:glycosyltransferase [Candidatus Peregrinibacteria bacterium]
MNKKFDQLRVAIVADWLTNYGGAESVVGSFMRIFPKADIFTTLFVPEEMKAISQKKVHTSFLQKFPKFLRKKHQIFLPLLPKAIESLDLSSYDLVLSSSSFVAKGCLTNPETLHICYCHTPTRYLWDDSQKYVEEFPVPKGLKWAMRFLPKMLSRLRIWDHLAAERPDDYIANSEFIAERIEKYYQKKSTVIEPPVDIKRFSQHRIVKKKNYYLAVGRLTPYKRFDLLIEAFRRLPQKKLKIAGKGPDFHRLLSIAKSAPNIEFLGFVPDEKLPELMICARAFLFPQIEDAGISLLEALASGTPVIALKKGGAKTLLRDGENGIFFEYQTPEDIIVAISRCESMKFDAKSIRKSAEKYDRNAFEKRIKQHCEEKWNEFSENSRIISTTPRGDQK